MGRRLLSKRSSVLIRVYQFGGKNQQEIRGDAFFRQGRWMIYCPELPCVNFVLKNGESTPNPPTTYQEFYAIRTQNLNAPDWPNKTLSFWNYRKIRNIKRGGQQNQKINKSLIVLEQVFVAKLAV
jgi:hypothetical protein